MGCHTWFFRKIESPPKETIIKVVGEFISKELDFLNRLINDRESIDNNLLESYPEKNIQFLLDEQNRLNNGSMSDEELNDYYCSQASNLIEYVEGRGFYSDGTGFHDLFRKHGYPDDKLFSYEETLAYINDPKNECTVCDWTNDKLKEFWEKFPDGMIQFG
jgi:hypothetical protein